MQFENRDVVVTGGCGGLGQEVVRWFAARGARVTVPEYGTRPSPFDDLDKVTVVGGLDLSDEDTVVEFYSRFESLWASVHLAGGFAMSPLLETSLEMVERQFKLNVVTAFLCSREAVRRMEGGGRIVNVSARPAAETAVPGMAAYTLTKGAVATLTKALAAECLPKGVFVNAIAPSIIDTPTNRQAMPDADFSKWPKAGDLAEAIGYLASPDNRVTSGTVLPVYGQA